MTRLFLKISLSSRDQMMEQLIQIFLFKMKMSMKDGIITHGKNNQNIKSSDTIDSKVKQQDLAILMKSNSLELKQLKTMIHNSNAMSSWFQIKNQHQLQIK